MSADVTQRMEIEVTLRELEASARANPYPEQRQMLEDQIRTLRSTLDTLNRMAPAWASPPRVPLAPHMAEFFTPEPPAPVPCWVPDGVVRAAVTPHHMRCPPGAQVYVMEDSLSCAIPGQPGVSPSRTHGLTLGFFSDGRLRSQTFYENGICRWAIAYHATGGRETVGFWSGVEAKDYVEEGLHTRFAPNGVVVAQSHWRSGKEEGFRKLWEDDGAPIGATRMVAGHAVEEVYPDGSRRAR